MKIANIIYENELVNHTKVDYVNYINKPIEYDQLDKELPTLFVGWSFMKLCNPNNSIIQNADILHKKIITNELYWEMSFIENKSSHINGIERFIKLSPEFYFSPKFSYVNLDPVFFQIKDIQDLMDVIPKQIKTCYIFKNEMIYLLSNNKIFGINLKMYGFFKFNISEIILQLSFRTETMITDNDGLQYQTYYKIFPNYTQLKRYLVVILSK